DAIGDQRADGPLLVTERLIEQAHLGVPLLQLAVDDLRADVLGLALDRRILSEVGLLRLEIRGRDGLLVDVLRGEAGHLDGAIAPQLLEFLGWCDEVRFAVDLDQDAASTAGVDVARDETLASLTR